eukprot:246247_1
MESKQRRLGCYILNSNDNALDSDEKRAAHAIQFGIFYDFNDETQLQSAADRLINSININSNVLMGYEFNDNNCSKNTLASQILLSFSTLSKQIHLLDENMAE